MAAHLVPICCPTCEHKPALTRINKQRAYIRLPNLSSLPNTDTESTITDDMAVRDLEQAVG